uniref:Uncharacterized protein n=1 Tax=Daucus carota subsp. sativus TaxID=79200 RepID=A0A162B053_DAUCS
MLSSISRVLVFMYERQPLPNIVTPSCNGCIPERVILIDSHDVIYFKTNLVLLGFLRRVNGWFYDYKVSEKRYELPPGDMGWPFIGNMWSFLLAFKSNNPDSFVSSFIQRVHSHFDRFLESGPYTLKYRGGMWYGFLLVLRIACFRL